MQHNFLWILLCISLFSGVCSIGIPLSGNLSGVLGWCRKIKDTFGLVDASRLPTLTLICLKLLRNHIQYSVFLHLCVNCFSQCCEPKETWGVLYLSLRRA